jgi:two-component sensor histidine kinase/ActR/RegA family two-component response regulator
MKEQAKANILLVDDQPAKLLTYEVILAELEENLIKASSAREALNHLLKSDIAVILMDVSMPDFDGFQLAAMIREHPRYKETAIIFVSAVHLSDSDYVKGYQMGAVDYVSAPVIPEILRAKVGIFVDLHRKSRELQDLNEQLEKRVTERTEELRRSNEQQVILAREVDHRAKNALAVAQAIVRLTQAETIEGHVAAIEGRISALARCHTLLSDARWRGASLKTVVEEELAPYATKGEPRYFIEGPEILLNPASVQGVALALHELATNAAKYGAFSTPRGRLNVSWRKSDSLVVSWQESGVDGVKPPLRAGFGTKIIRLGVETQSGGQVLYNWRPDGLDCQLRFPGTTGQASTLRGSSEMRDGDRRLLVAEDEPLVGSMIAELIRNLGYDVLGPYSTLSEALLAGDATDLFGAILGVNLGGEMVFPLAEKLKGKKVPFIFITGYGPERINQCYADAPTLAKPIEMTALVSILAEALNIRARESTVA